MEATTAFANPTGAGTAGSETTFTTAAPQMALLEFFFPGFSMFSGAVQRYLHLDLNVYIPLIFMGSGALFAWRYFSEYFWSELESHFMSTVDVRTDDEAYNMLMSWVARQRFAQRSRRFVVNTNLNSRSWWVFRWDEDDDEDDSGGGTSKREARKLSYTPTFGSHYFWYKGRLLIFRRTQNREQSSFLTASEREEISVSCFGRNPWILKELLLEARAQYMQRDERKTVIYRGTTKSGSTEPSWQRCMARTARPLSTVILNEKVKQNVIEDVSDYLNPATRRWYSNRGIPYRRGFLLHGPPGCGKSSLSLALAGHFKMPIYMVSLSSVTASEENLATLFAELPRRCVVLLEDIDTAGLTHTRDENKVGEVVAAAPADGAGSGDMVPGQVTPGIVVGAPAPNNSTGRLSLSGLLNILDGVASQDSRVLLMSTNHIEKLDKALIRPGRVDMIVKFDLADKDMVAAIFRHIYAPLEGDDEQPADKAAADAKVALADAHDPDAAAKRLAAEKARREEAVERVTKMAVTFADRIPAHEFSPAELQGYLMKNKRDAEAALAGAEKWVVDMRKEKKEKELKEAEDKRKAEDKAKKEAEEAEKKKAEEKKKEEEEKKKEEEEKKKKEEKEERRKRKEKERAKRKRRTKKDDPLSGSESSLSESSEDESAAAEPPKMKKEASTVSTTETVVVVKKPESAETEAADGKLQVEEGKKGTGTDSGYGTP